MSKRSSRTERRARERALSKLATARERLATLEEGGSPRRPIEVESASQVETHARSLQCVRCGGSPRLDEHTAETVDEQRLRVARMTCPGCGGKRTVYFRIRLVS
jgi:hypothetical protein